MKSSIIEKPPFAEIDGELSIKDISIPTEVRGFLISNRSRHIAVAEYKDILWVASKLKAKRIELRKYKEFQVCYMKKAKGNGFVAIQAWPQEKGKSCVNIIDLGKYTDQALDSAINIAKQLEPILRYKLNEDYWGADC